MRAQQKLLALNEAEPLRLYPDELQFLFAVRADWPRISRGFHKIKFLRHKCFHRPNGSNQRLATLDDPYRPILSRVRCIAWFAISFKDYPLVGISGATKNCKAFGRYTPVDDSPRLLCWTPPTEVRQDV